MWSCNFAELVWIDLIPDESEFHLEHQLSSLYNSDSLLFQLTFGLILTNSFKWSKAL